MKTVNKKMHDILDLSFEEQLSQTQDIMKIRTVLDETKSTEEHPFGADVTAGLTDFLERAAAMGFKVKNIDNHIGYAEIGDDGELIGILAHLDVVPEGKLEDWKHPPYDAVIDNGELYGRGALDDKGPAMAALYALKAMRESGVPLKRRFRLILGLDEESGSRCITHYNKTEEEPVFSFSPDAEFPVVNAEKGILRATITVNATSSAADAGCKLTKLDGGDRFNVVPDGATAIIECSTEDAERICRYQGDFEIQRTAGGLSVKSIGVPAHAMEPSKGVNAVQKLLKFLSNIEFNPADAALIKTVYSLVGEGHSGKELGIAVSDEISGLLTCNVAAANLSRDSDHSKVELKFDIRYPVTADSEAVIENIKTAVKTAGSDVVFHAHKKPLYVPESHPAVRILLDAYEGITGDRPAPISMGGGTYCRFMPNAVSAGPVFPGQEELAHQANERVSVEDLRKSTHIYAEALARFNEM